ncbi:unnamed protein product [Alternaria alternata]
MTVTNSKTGEKKLISALRWKQLDDNKLLGVEQLGDDEVRKLIRDIALESK